MQNTISISFTAHAQMINGQLANKIDKKSHELACCEVYLKPVEQTLYSAAVPIKKSEATV